MIHAYIDIDDEPRTRDTFYDYNMTYIDSDDIFAPPTKKLESTSYAEENGEHCDPRTSYAPFDFKIKYLVYTQPAPLRNLVRSAMPRGVESDFDTAGEMPRNWTRSNEPLAVRYNANGIFEAKLVSTMTEQQPYAAIQIMLAEELNAGETYTLRVTGTVRGLTEGIVRLGWHWNYNNTREVRLTTNGEFRQTYVFQTHSTIDAGALQRAFIIMQRTNAGTEVEIKSFAIYKGRHPDAVCYTAPEDTLDLNRAITLYNADVTTASDNMIECRRITVTIPYKKLRIVGLAQPIANEDVTDFSRIHGVDTCQVSTTVHVDDPTLCDYCLE